MAYYPRGTTHLCRHSLLLIGSWILAGKVEGLLFLNVTAICDNSHVQVDFNPV